MKFQPVINLIGLLLCTLSAFMLIPGFVDYILGDEDWAAFLVSSFITLFVGAGLYLSSRESNPEHLELILNGYIKYKDGKLFRNIILELFKNYKFII